MNDFLKGSAKRSPTQFQTELAMMGAHLKSYTDRESSAFFVECLASDAEKGGFFSSDKINKIKNID